MYSFHNHVSFLFFNPNIVHFLKVKQLWKESKKLLLKKNVENRIECGFKLVQIAVVQLIQVFCILQIALLEHRVNARTVVVADAVFDLFDASSSFHKTEKSNHTLHKQGKQEHPHDLRMIISTSQDLASQRHFRKDSHT